MSDEKILVELRQRATRIESRICRIAEFLGAQIGRPDKEFLVSEETPTHVDVDIFVMDVSLSAVIQFLTKSGKAGKIADIYFNDKLVATIHPTA